LLVTVQAHLLVNQRSSMFRVWKGPGEPHDCHNPSFGLATKARGCKVASQVGDPGALHILPGVQRV
jgi:hypothetical protein